MSHLVAFEVDCFEEIVSVREALKRSDLVIGQIQMAQILECIEALDALDLVGSLKKSLSK